MQFEQERQIIKIYRQLHQMPEIGLQQYKTTQYIIDYVSKIDEVEILKPQVQTDLKTGCIVLIASEKQSQNNSYLFRCDIDALNFPEQSQLQYSSTNGLHHACGHDAHTAIMLLAVKKIAKAKKELKRSIYFCFQPGQQGHGGASKMLEKYPSLFKNISHCFALHIANHREKQKLLIPREYATSNSNRFQIQIHGKSAHCMLPEAAVDANYIGCQVVNQIYSLKTRLIKPSQGVAVSVTKLEGGSNNLTSISDYMKISGSIRSYSLQDHEKLFGFIQKYVKCICEVNGATYKFTKNNSWYRSVKNQQSAINIVVKASKNIFPQIEFSSPSFAGQDFCQFSQRKPSCYFNLAVGLPNSLNAETLQSNFPIHSSRFKLDQNALWKGSELWFRIATQ